MPTHKKRRYRLRKGARSAQEDLLERLERIQRRLKAAYDQSYDALTVERAIELIQADLAHIEKWLQVDFEEITRFDYHRETEDDDDDRVAALERQLHAMEQQLQQLQQVFGKAIGKRDAG
jgi:hypothetical protein